MVTILGQILHLYYFVKFCRDRRFHTFWQEHPWCMSAPIAHWLVICSSPLNWTDYCGCCFIKIVRRWAEGREGRDAAATDPIIVFVFVIVFRIRVVICICCFIKIARRKAEERGGASCWPKFPTSLPFSTHPIPSLPFPPCLSRSGGLVVGYFMACRLKAIPSPWPPPHSQHHLTTFPSQATWTSYCQVKTR